MKGPWGTFCVEKRYLKKKKYLFLWMFVPGSPSSVPVSSVQKFILLLHCSLQSLYLSSEWETSFICLTGESRGFDQLFSSWNQTIRICSEVTETQSHIQFPFCSGTTVFPLAKGLEGCEHFNIAEMATDLQKK